MFKIQGANVVPLWHLKGVKSTHFFKTPYVVLWNASKNAKDGSKRHTSNRVRGFLCTPQGSCSNCPSPLNAWRCLALGNTRGRVKCSEVSKTEIWGFKKKCVDIQTCPRYTGHGWEIRAQWSYDDVFYLCRDISKFSLFMPWFAHGWSFLAKSVRSSETRRARKARKKSIRQLL